MTQNVKALKKKIGFGLKQKMMALALIPLTIMAVLGIQSIELTARKNSENIVEQELEAMIYSFDLTMEVMDEGEYHYTDDKLYKGELCVTDNQDILDEFQAHTSVDVTIFWGDTRRATSLKNESGRIIGTKASEEVIEHTLKNGEKFFISDVVINGEEYYGFYEPFYISGKTEPAGMVFLGMKATDIKAQYMTQFAKSVTVMIIVFVAASATLFIVMTKIIKNITDVVHNIDEIATGKLNCEINPKLLLNKDETGETARSVSLLVKSLSEIVGGLINTSGNLNTLSGDFDKNLNTISDSMKNIDIAVEEIANGAASQANETQRVSEEMERMNSAIDKTTDNTNDLSASAVVLGDCNKSVEQTLAELVQISHETEESVKAVYEQTVITNKSALDIRSATEIIAGIASQTNLLSLNASIEAARAGEQGRGFAVVADEIRELAEQSRKSAEHINSIVENLIANSDTSVREMQGMNDKIVRQGNTLNSTKQVFDKLNNEVSNVSVAINNISDEINNIEKLKELVLGGIESLAAIAEENAAGTEETAASIAELRRVVTECAEATGQLVEMAEELNSDANKFTL